MAKTQKLVTFHIEENSKKQFWKYMPGCTILQSSRALLLPHAVAIFQAHYPAQGGEDYDTLLVTH